jgi:hypothetical protein
MFVRMASGVHTSVRFHLLPPSALTSSASSTQSQIAIRSLNITTYLDGGRSTVCMGGHHSEASAVSTATSTSTSTSALTNKIECHRAVTGIHVTHPPHKSVLSVLQTFQIDAARLARVWMVTLEVLGSTVPSAYDGSSSSKSRSTSSTRQKGHDTQRKHSSIGVKEGDDSHNNTAVSLGCVILADRGLNGPRGPPYQTRGNKQQTQPPTHRSVHDADSDIILEPLLPKLFKLMTV